MIDARNVSGLADLSEAAYLDFGSIPTEGLSGEALNARLAINGSGTVSDGSLIPENTPGRDRSDDLIDTGAGADLVFAGIGQDIVLMRTERKCLSRNLWMQRSAAHAINDDIFAARSAA